MVPILSDHAVSDLSTKVSEDQGYRGGPLFLRVNHDQCLGQDSGLDSRSPTNQSSHLQPGSFHLDGVKKLGSTPIKFDKLNYHLHIYPNKQDAKLLKKGFEQGFRVPYEGNSYQTNINKSGKLSQNTPVTM